MSKEQKSDTDQRQFWQMVLDTCKESDLSIAAFCKKEGISVAAYYYWRKKLVGSHPKSNRKTPPAFIEVALPQSNAAVLELVLSSGNTLRINPGADNKMLLDVLSALRQADLC
jgi:hypothetical protein